MGKCRERGEASVGEVRGQIRPEIFKRALEPRERSLLWPKHFPARELEDKTSVL